MDVCDVYDVVTCADSDCMFFFFFLMIRRPPRSTLDRSSAASDVYKRQDYDKKAAAISSAATEGRITILNAALDDAVGRLLPDPKSGLKVCLLYTSPSPRDRTRSRMPSSA